MRFFLRIKGLDINNDGDIAMILNLKIEEYIQSLKHKRGLYYSITQQPFWQEINEKLTFLKIPSDWSIMRKLWHVKNDTLAIPLCKECNLNQAKWQVYNHSYGVCSQKCCSISNMKNIAKNLKDKYGNDVTNVFQLKKIKEKAKKTLISKYGTDNISKLDSIKTQKAETLFNNFGRAHNFEPEYFKNILLKKYGVENAAHIPSVIESSVFNRFKKRKSYILPTGETIFLQGYEPYALDELLLVYDISEIKYKKSDVPRIFYTMGGKKHCYYPDFYIEKYNKLIEVKCPYTYENELEKNKLKEEACKNNNYDFEFWIYKTKIEKNVVKN